MAKTYDILQATAIFPETAVDRVVFTNNFGSDFGSYFWQTANGVTQSITDQFNSTTRNQIRTIVKAPTNGICRINNLAIHAYVRGGLKIVMWHGTDNLQVRFHELNGDGILWSPPEPVGTRNELSSPITKPQETTKFTIFSKEEPFYLLSEQSIYVGLQEVSQSFRVEQFTLSYVCSYDLLLF